MLLLLLRVLQERVGGGGLSREEHPGDVGIMRGPLAGGGERHERRPGRHDAGMVRGGGGGGGGHLGLWDEYRVRAAVLLLLLLERL